MRALGFCTTNLSIIPYAFYCYSYGAESITYIYTYGGDNTETSVKNYSNNVKAWS